MAWSLGSTPKISSASSTSAPVSLPLVLKTLTFILLIFKGKIHTLPKKGTQKYTLQAELQMFGVKILESRSFRKRKSTGFINRAGLFISAGILFSPSLHLNFA